MEGKATAEDGELVIGVGMTGSRKSKETLKWAMEKFLLENNVRFKLLHVYPKITAVPTPLGNWLPIEQVQEDEAAHYRQEIHWKKNKSLLPYRQMLRANKIAADIVVLESDDVAMAISLEANKQAIRHLVIGVSSNWTISWKNLSVKKRGRNLSATISETAPKFCSVYVVAAGKLEHLRTADPKSNVINTDSTDSSISTGQPTEPESSQKDKAASKRLAWESMELKHIYPDMDLSFGNSSVMSISSISGDSQSSFSAYSGSPFADTSSRNLSCAVSFTGSETGVSSGQFFFPLGVSKRHMEGSLTLREESHKELWGNTKRNTLQRKAEEKTRETEDNDKKFRQQLESSGNQYKKFTLEEIAMATSSFSDEFKIGEGSFGTVYKCKLQHTTVAVKFLHSKDSATGLQFHQELEILSKIRHPHLLLLVGAIPEERCLVYEYMENGSLEDRLFQKDNRPPLPWYDRFRICWEVAGALAFLHSAKPTPIIHRDLKPANILLDQNLVSKIGDASLGTMINMEPTNMSLRTQYKKTSLVGTLYYLDPEYQRTGRVSTKSDIYALGVVILQLLTAKPAVGVACMVEDAIDEGNLTEVLDQDAGKWPEKEALELALLGLQCAELRGRDRPDLREEVLPVLERLKEMADSAKEQASSAPAALPTHFICPIRKEVMEDPYVAADGYSYDRTAIEQWLAENNTSPATSLPLPHKFILPDYTLLEAIKQWKSKQPPKRWLSQGGS